MVSTVGTFYFHFAGLMPIEPFNLRVQLLIGPEFAATDIGDYFAADSLAGLCFRNAFEAHPIASFGEYIGLQQLQRFTDRLVVVYRDNNLIHTFNALQDLFSILGRPEYKSFLPEKEIVVVKYHDQPVTQSGRLPQVGNMTYMYGVEGSTYRYGD
jgi:hypothetical protein